MSTIVLGAQWGDEGKGKLVDILLPGTQLCARAQGGNNAGHTIVAGGVTYDFHLLPSGLLNPQCMNLIGSGVVANIREMFEELDALEAKGLHVSSSSHVYLKNSADRRSVVFDLHQRVDGLEEKALGGKKVGTTGKGIGPCYANKASRSGVRVAEVFNEGLFEGKLRALAATYKLAYGDLLQYDVEEEINRFKEYRVRLAPLVCDAIALISSAEEKNMKIMIEGANAIMLDIDHGTYPYVTSSNTGLGGILTGLALNPRKIDKIVGVVKAYTTRVGAGPFPTEDLGPDGQPGEVGRLLQTVGREVGVTTGRPRRCGHLDLVVVKYSNTVNHYDSINLTKLDILDTLPTLKVAIAYRDPVTKEALDSFPADLDLLASVEVEYKEFPGWMKPTTGARSFYDLPMKAREYVQFIEEFIGVRVGYIGVGPAREDMIVR